MADLGVRWGIDYGLAVLRPTNAIVILSAKEVAMRGRPSREDITASRALYRPVTHDWVFTDGTHPSAVRPARAASRTSVIGRVGFTGQRRRAFGR